MNNILIAWKPIGLTPLEVIEKFKTKHPDLKNEKISYAGRLDPMAEGIILLLIGEENKKREKYLKLKKKYDAEIIIGITTDSFDQLGIILKVNSENIDDELIENELLSFLGKSFQNYPPFSSKVVLGKPLFWWARNKKIKEIEIPGKEIEIYNLEINETDFISGRKIAESVIRNVENLKGDFRQKEIIESWKIFLEKYENFKFKKIKIEIECSSGSYVRSVADDLGKKLKLGAFTFSIKRKEIGIFKEDDVEII